MLAVTLSLFQGGMEDFSRLLGIKGTLTLICCIFCIFLPGGNYYTTFTLTQLQDQFDNLGMFIVCLNYQI